MAALSLNRHTTPRPGGVVFTARGVPPAPRAAGAPARRFPSDRRRLLARPLVTTPHSALAVPTSALRASRRASRAPTLVVRASGGRDLAQYPVADRRAELSKMTVAQLKPLCKGSGLRLGGKKSELVDRLLEHEFGTTDDEADIDPREDIVGLAKEWRAERGVGGGVSFGEVDRVEAALSVRRHSSTSEPPTPPTPRSDSTTGGTRARPRRAETRGPRRTVRTPRG